VGPLDLLSIYGGDPHIYLTPFLDLPQFNDMEHPIVYPPIKELVISHPLMLQDKEECITAIVEFAKSQHARGIPFDRVVFCMEKLPTAIAERLKPWVGIVDCYEELSRRMDLKHVSEGALVGLLSPRLYVYTETNYTIHYSSAQQSGTEFCLLNELSLVRGLLQV
jgi:hypothetical protein